MNYSSEFVGQFHLLDCLEAAGTVIEEIIIIGCVFNCSCTICPSDTAIVSTSTCPSILRFHTMKSCVFFVLCILAFVSSQDAAARHKMPGSNSAINSPTKGQTTPVGGATIPEGSGKVPTSYLTYGSHRATRSPTRSEKRRPSPTRVPKSSGKVPTSYPTISTTGSPKTSVKPTTGTTSRQKPKSVISQGSDTSTKTPKSSPPPATTTATLTTRIPTGTSPLVISASKTLTVSNGQTASAQVGWMVVGVGAGGSVVVGGNILPVAGGTEAIIEQNSSGQDELSTIESDTSTTPTSTSTSTKASKSSSSSSSTSSSMASPTPYNIYPKFDSTPSQQSAFARNLEQIAQRGSVRSITGGRNRLLLWVASLTPAQASELTRNPVVSPLPGAIHFYH